MSHYIMSDIHGCYDEFIDMLGKIHFSSKDILICAGDYIDRGKQSYEMLRWIENRPSNVILVKGSVPGAKGAVLKIKSSVKSK